MKTLLLEWDFGYKNNHDFSKIIKLIKLQSYKTVSERIKH
jgi:hypothetical protein